MIRSLLKLRMLMLMSACQRRLPRHTWVGTTTRSQDVPVASCLLASKVQTRNNFQRLSFKMFLFEVMVQGLCTSKRNGPRLPVFSTERGGNRSGQSGCVKSQHAEGALGEWVATFVLTSCRNYQMTLNNGETCSLDFVEVNLS